MGERWKEQGLVCTTEVGTPLCLSNLRSRLAQLCAAANMPRIRIYDLRHTATSLMIDGGADLKAASETLGHRDPGITTRVYWHVRGDQRTQAMSALAAQLDEPVTATPVSHSGTP